MTDQLPPDDPSACSGLPGCATVMQALGGDPAGTAAWMRSWLLIEQPGPWGPEALQTALSAALPPARLARLDELRLSHGLRTLLIRRPGRHHRDPRRRRRTVLVGGGDPGNRWLESIELERLEDIASLDVEAVASGAGGIGMPVHGPAFLVCTHGTKDLCCAVLGRPLAAALDAEFPGRVWETSHVGGDRWAGNLLVVPDGILHGHLDPEEAARIAKAALDGQVDPDHLRGRTGASQPAQAAEIAVRRLTGLRGVEDVLAEGERVLPVGADGPEAWEVTVRAGHAAANGAGRRAPTGTVYTVRVERRRTGGRGLSRCAGLIRPSAFVVSTIEPPAAPLRAG